MRVQNRAAMRRREARRVSTAGSFRLVGKIDKDWAGSGPGSGGSGGEVVVCGGEEIEGSASFSSSMAGEGEGNSCTAGIHCFAIFFSTKTTRKIISKTINPNAMKKTL